MDLLPAKVVYAPFLGLVLWPVSSTTPKRIKTGTLERGSKVAITPIMVGKPHDQRFVACDIKITALDCEALGSTIQPFQDLMNQMVYGGFLCSGGAFTDGPFRYTVFPELLEQRGMRWVHQLTGRSRWPGWTTFLDNGWDGVKQMLGESTAPFLQ